MDSLPNHSKKWGPVPDRIKETRLRDSGDRNLLGSSFFWLTGMMSVCICNLGKACKRLHNALSSWFWPALEGLMMVTVGCCKDSYGACCSGRMSCRSQLLHPGAANRKAPLRMEGPCLCDSAASVIP